MNYSYPELGYYIPKLICLSRKARHLFKKRAHPFWKKVGSFFLTAFKHRSKRRIRTLEKWVGTPSGLSRHSYTNNYTFSFCFAYNIKNKIVLSVVIYPTTLSPYRTLSGTSAQILFRILRQSFVWHSASSPREHHYQSAYAP